MAIVSITVPSIQYQVRIELNGVPDGVDPINLDNGLVAPTIYHVTPAAPFGSGLLVFSILGNDHISVNGVGGTYYTVSLIDTLAQLTTYQADFLIIGSTANLDTQTPLAVAPSPGSSPLPMSLTSFLPLAGGTMTGELVIKAPAIADDLFALTLASDASKRFHCWWGNDGGLHFETVAGSGADIFFHPDGGTVHLNTSLDVTGGNALIKNTGRIEAAFDPSPGENPALWLGADETIPDTVDYLHIRPASVAVFDNFLRFIKTDGTDAIKIDANGVITFADTQAFPGFATEVSTRASADTTLQSNITAEVTRAEAAESSEATTRATVDTTLQNNINSESSTRASADTTESTARSSADTTLQNNINTEASTRSSDDSTETTARIAGDSTTLSSAESYTDTHVSSEATSRASADTTLQTNITNESNTRASADTTLQNNINSEASTRATADATTLSSAESYTDTSIATEVTNRNTAISTETSRATTAEALFVPKTTSVNGRALSGNISLTATDVGAVIVQDTLKNILASTATLGVAKWSTDYEQLLVGDGANWWVLDGFLNKKLQNPDIGLVNASDRTGYGTTYITDKIVANCQIGANNTTKTGGFRFNQTTNVLEVYVSGAWQQVVANFRFQEISADNYALEHKPVGFTQWIQIYSGNSDTLGTNGLPLIQGYRISMGSCPFLPTVSGGTF